MLEWHCFIYFRGSSQQDHSPGLCIVDGLALPSELQEVLVVVEVSSVPEERTVDLSPSISSFTFTCLSCASGSGQTTPPPTEPSGMPQLTELHSTGRGCGSQGTRLRLPGVIPEVTTPETATTLQGGAVSASQAGTRGD